MTPDEREGLEDLLTSNTGNAIARAWIKRQLEHNDWDNSIARMGGGKKARDAYMHPIFDTACAVTAFDMHAQLTGDGRERGLWIWLLDESKARAEIYDTWAADALTLFCKLAGIDDKTSEKFRLSMAMNEFKRVAAAKVHEAALLEWPSVKKLHDAIGKALRAHATKKHKTSKKTPRKR